MEEVRRRIQNDKIFRAVILALLTFVLTFKTVSSGTECYAYTTNEVGQLIDGVISNRLKSSGSASVQDWINGPLTAGAGTASEWYIMSLRQSGYSDFSSYEQALSAYLESHNVPSATSRLKYALALCAAGSTNSYIEDILDSSIGQQGIMSYIYGLHVLNNGYTCSGYTAQSVIDTLLSLQYADGGWALYGGNGDIDVTAMTVHALAPYYSNDSSVRSAVDRAVAFLSGKQQNDGGYQSFGTPNPESAAQVLVALSALGIDCENDSRFVKNGNTLIAGIAKYRLSDGSFCHLEGGDSNETATFQAFYSLISYTRMKSGKGPLFVFDNRQTVKTDEQTNTDSKTQSQSSQSQTGQSQNKNSASSGSGSQNSGQAQNAKAAEKNFSAAGTASSDTQTDSAQEHAADTTGSEQTNALAVSEQPMSAEAVSADAVTGDAVSGEAVSAEAVSAGAVSDTVLSGTAAKNSRDKNTASSDKNDSQKSAQKNNSYKLWAILEIVGVGAVVSAVFYFLKKRNYKNFIVIGAGVAIGIAIVLLTNFSSKEDYYTGTKEQKENAIGTVTMSIRCDTVVGKSDSEYIPEDGTILDTTEFEIEEGDTVFSVLTQAAKTYGIQVENTGSSGNAHGMVYISGINYLYEMEFGDLSGWVYHVNGLSPSRNCGEYTLKDGDVIEWLYTCELGYDLNEVYEDDVIKE